MRFRVRTLIVLISCISLMLALNLRTRYERVQINSPTWGNVPEYGIAENWGWPCTIHSCDQCNGLWEIQYGIRNRWALGSNLIVGVLMAIAIVVFSEKWN